MEPDSRYAIIVAATGRGVAKNRATILNGKVYTDLDEAQARFEQISEDDYKNADCYHLVQF